MAIVKITGKAPIINHSILPVATGVNALLLNDRELSIVRQVLFPYLWRTRIALEPFDGPLYTTISDEAESALREELEALETKLSGGVGMDVKDLVQGWYSELESFAKYHLDLNLGAGSVYLQGDVVPAGEQWHIRHLYWRFNSATINQVTVRAYVKSQAIWLAQVMVPTTLVYYPMSVNLVLSAGDYLLVGLVNATAGDDVWLAYCGHKVNVD